MATSTTGTILVMVTKVPYPDAASSRTTTSTPTKLGMDRDTRALLPTMVVRSMLSPDTMAAVIRAAEAAVAVIRVAAATRAAETVAALTTKA
jgi:hypothetical protein